MQDRASSLDAAVVTSTENPAAMCENRADRDSAFSQSLTCFLQCGGEQWIVHVYIVVIVDLVGKSEHRDGGGEAGMK